MHYIYKDSVKQ